MAGRKVTSYTGGVRSDPNQPCYTWWDYIMARSQKVCEDPGIFRGAGASVPPPPGVPREGAPIFTDEFYRGLAEQVPLQSGYLSPYLGAPVVPTLDLMRLKHGLGNLLDINAAQHVYQGFLPGDSWAPLVASAGVGNVAVVSIRNNVTNSKRVYPIFISLASSAGNFGWRRHNSALSTNLSGGLGGHPRRCTDDGDGAPVTFTSQDIAAASFPPAGASQVRALTNKATYNFAAASPTIVALGWLKPGQGFIVYVCDAFGIALTADARPAGNWTIWEE